MARTEEEDILSSTSTTHSDLLAAARAAVEPARHARPADPAHTTLTFLTSKRGFFSLPATGGVSTSMADMIVVVDD